MNKIDRAVRCLAEDYKNRPMVRKVDNYEYESLAQCIRSEQVPMQHIAEFFTDPDFYKWHSERYFK